MARNFLSKGDREGKQEMKYSHCLLAPSVRRAADRTPLPDSPLRGKTVAGSPHSPGHPADIVLSTRTIADS
jgi:hypothetical protein